MIADKLANPIHNIELALVSLNTMDRVLGSTPQILAAAAIEITPLARAQLTSSLNASGIQSRSGRLAGAVASAVVQITKKGLRISVENDNFAKVGALNFGAPGENIAPRNFLKVNDSAIRDSFYAAVSRLMKVKGR